jgi:DNA primase
MDTKSFEVVFLAELNKYTKCEPASDGEYRICCPYHDDKNPSCFVNPSKNVFSCKSAQCGKSGNGYELLAKLSNKPLSLVMEEFGANEKTVEPQVVEKYHSKIWDAKDLLHELYKRGVTDDLIRKYRLGEKDGRITIPIKNKLT